MVMEVLAISPLIKLVLCLLALLLMISLCKLFVDSYYSISQRHVRLQTELDLGETLADLSSSMAGANNGLPHVPIIVIVPVDRHTVISENSQLSRILRQVPAPIRDTAISMNGKSKATFVYWHLVLNNDGNKLRSNKNSTLLWHIIMTINCIVPPVHLGCSSTAWPSPASP